ncbi:SCO family protein [Pseudothauera rhizosphaerae]|uniref:SCO family protein n=1 Tax=Pseudothauera rhizosphaerae TaxID=2565932 RepID=A0A4S4AB91_9RHOO|nr:SCO family protein [Pseudothauera rhizosphaerae]THF56195.1 SCO family protein [Pseudothauera rhizosphaerae]
MPALLRRTLTALAAASLALLAACSEPPPAFHATDITGAPYGRQFALTDHRGQPRTLEDFRGKVVTLFFGFTQCPDVCPTSLLTMGEVMRQLGPDAERVQALFVTVDPERDTQALLAEYVPTFDPRFLGLYGDLARTAEVAKEFRIFYRKSGDTSGTSYTIDHSAGTYILDQQGRLRLYVKHGENAENIAADIRLLLTSK